MTASLLIVGRGRMGRLVEALSPDYGFQVAGTVDIDNAAQHEAWPQADVAIDFSLADAVPVNFPRLAARGMNIVIELQNENGTRETLHVDRAGRYHLDGKPVTLVKAFRWYANKSPNAMSASSDDYRREGRFLRKVAALLK